MHLLTAVALFLQAQDRTAEETFHKIEEVIEKARTLRFMITYERTDVNDRSTKGSGILLLKEGNKALYSTNNGGGDFWRICDGSRVGRPRPRAYDEGILASEGRRTAITPASPELEKDLRVLFCRGGMAVNGWGPDPFDPAASIRPKEVLHLSAFQHGADSGKSKTLRYRLRWGDTRPVGVTLAYDPESFMILGRTTTQREADGRRWTLTEDYTGSRLNDDLPEEKFKLPEE